MSAKDVLSGEEKKESSRPIGTGTKVAGYVDTPVPKKCGTCEYLINGNLCKNARVLKDPQVPFAKRSKLKKVNAENGCCSFWEPENSEDKD